MVQKEIPYKIYLEEDEMPRNWYNVRADMKRKPDAEPVRYAVDSLGCDRAVYVGDSDIDVLTAKNAELPCISVTWGFRDKAELEACGANVFANDTKELETIILKLLDAEDLYAPN